MDHRNAERQASAAARRTELGRIRARVRAQLADSQHRRQEVSRALVALRRGLVEVRNSLRGGRRETKGDGPRHQPAAAPPPPSAAPGTRCKP